MPALTRGSRRGMRILGALRLAPATALSFFHPGFRSHAKACCAAVLLLATIGLAGCGGHKRTVRVQTPPPPPPTTAPGKPANAPAETAPAENTVTVPPDVKPIYVETGLASWYGPPYHNRRGANGEVFDMNQPTAAHRTLPLNSVVRVTNLKTEHSTLVRITDRGPFVPDRIIDLSVAAAKAVDVWRPGTAEVRLDVLQAPVPINKGGRWCVQIGGFAEEKTARKLQDKLTRKYHTANVLAFVSPVGVWWVRVRVLEDDKHRAEELLRDTKTSEGHLFLVRLD